MERRPDNSRRRFIKAGLVTTPVIVTLSARPAWAQDSVNGTLGTYGYATDLQEDLFSVQPQSTTTEEPSLF